MYSLIPKVLIFLSQIWGLNFIGDGPTLDERDTKFIICLLRKIADDLERTLDDNIDNDGWLRRLEPTLAPLYYQTESDLTSSRNRIFVDDFAKVPNLSCKKHWDRSKFCDQNKFLIADMENPLIFSKTIHRDDRPRSDAELLARCDKLCMESPSCQGYQFGRMFYQCQFLFGIDENCRETESSFVAVYCKDV